MPITRLSLHRFRGATESVDLCFSNERKLILIFGENGSGKSTIVDGIDLVCNRSGGSIQEISSTSIAEHLHSLGATQSQLRVDVECDGIVCTGQVSGNRVQVQETSNPPAACILRRSKLLRLVTAEPALRFAELKRLIDIEPVLRSEDNLTMAVTDVRDQLTAKTRDQALAEESLKAAYADERTEAEAGLTAEKWAEGRIAASPEKTEANAKALDALLVIWQQAEILLEKKNDRQMELNEARKLWATENGVLAELLTSLPDIVTEILPLLQDAVAYFKAASEVDACPVCLQPIATDAVRVGIEQRLESLKAVVDQKQKIQQAEQSVKHLEAVTGRAYSDLAERLHDFLVALAAATDEATTVIAIRLSDFPHLFTWNGALTSEVSKDITSLLAALFPLKETATRRNEELQKYANQLGSVKRALATVQSARKEAEALQRTLDQLQAFLDVVRKTRIAFTNTILEAIADECDRLYQQIHPDEGIGAVRFHLDEERRGSLHQTGTFAGQPGKTPQAYFSESHLDTLGFCFFLALARYTTGGACVIVLDDVFASADLRHIQRILQVLLKECNSFQQIILTTHQRRWLDLVKTHEVARRDIEIKELFPWSIETGLVCDDVPTHVERLREAAVHATTPRESLASQSGQAIEMVLGTMTRFLGCNVQRNPTDRYSAIDLLNSLKKPANKLRFRVDDVDDVLSPDRLRRLLDVLTESVLIVRNTLGAHFNWDGCDIDHATVRQFAQDTLEVVDLFLCADCESLPTREKQGFLTCSCGKRQVLKDWRS